MTHDPVRHGNTRIFPASLDPRAVDVVSRLTRAGYESYLVGGCVRDLLLGHIPKDFDVSTQARPRQIRRVFRNCRIIGRRFKLAHVHFGDQIIEVATFRRNPSENQDGEADADDLLITRDNEFGTAEEDTVRRDFTINALLYDVGANEVIDYVGGFEDIEQRTLRMIGEPTIRLAEDPVRMLRAVKFTARLGLTVEPELEQALRDCAPLIEKSAPARVIEEIFKLLTCGKAQVSLRLLQEYGLLERLMPEVAEHWGRHPERLVAYGEALDRVDGGTRRVSNALLLAVLFHDPWRELYEGDGGGDAMQSVADLVAPAALRTSIPRRDVARMKQMLVTQLRLARTKRGRRFRMNDFLARPSTAEAVELLHLRARVGAEDPERHAEWAERLARRLGEDEAGPGGPEADARQQEDGGEGRSRRRRRRGGRRRRRRRGDEDERPEAGDGDRTDAPDDDSPSGDPGTEVRDEPTDEEGERRPRRRRRRRRRRSDGDRDQDAPRAVTDDPAADEPPHDDARAARPDDAGSSRRDEPVATADDDPTPPDPEPAVDTEPTAEPAPGDERPGEPRFRRVEGPEAAPRGPTREQPADAQPSRPARPRPQPKDQGAGGKRGLGGLVRSLFRPFLSPAESAPDPDELTTPSPPEARSSRLPEARPLRHDESPRPPAAEDLAPVESPVEAPPETVGETRPGRDEAEPAVAMDRSAAEAQPHEDASARSGPAAGEDEPTTRAEPAARDAATPAEGDTAGAAPVAEDTPSAPTAEDGGPASDPSVPSTPETAANPPTAGDDDAQDAPRAVEDPRGAPAADDGAPSADAPRAPDAATAETAADAASDDAARAPASRTTDAPVDTDTPDDATDDDTPAEDGPGRSRRRRSRRRRRGSRRGEAGGAATGPRTNAPGEALFGPVPEAPHPQAQELLFGPVQESAPVRDSESDSDGETDGDGTRRRRRRRRRRGRGRGSEEGGSGQARGSRPDDRSADGREGDGEGDGGDGGRRKRRRRRRSGEGGDGSSSGSGRRKGSGGRSSGRGSGKSSGKSSGQRSGRSRSDRDQGGGNRSQPEDGRLPPRQAEDVEDLFDW